MAPLLDLALGDCNNRDQAAEDKRTQQDTRKAEQLTQIVAVAISPALRPQCHPIGNKERSKGRLLQLLQALF